jgi:hypothetical protein
LTEKPGGQLIATQPPNIIVLAAFFDEKCGSFFPV